MKMIHLTCPDHPEATLEGYILDCELTLGQETARPAIVVCPGGGYVYCSPREGEPVALSYAAQGYHTFILRYSTGWDAKGFAPLEEIDWVIGLLRENAESWHINPEKILTCGFSAGGHLALAAGLLAKNRPNGMILGYPAVNISGAGFMTRLLAGEGEAPEVVAEKVDLLNHVTGDAPPLFLVATAEDALTPGGALALANRYSELSLGYELHIFQHGPHGYSLATGVCADGSSQVLNPAFAHWLELSVYWMPQVFGKPVFTDKSTSKMAGYLKELGFALPGQSKGADFA